MGTIVWWGFSFLRPLPLFLPPSWPQVPMASLLGGVAGTTDPHCSKKWGCQLLLPSWARRAWRGAEGGGGGRGLSLRRRPAPRLFLQHLASTGSSPVAPRLPDTFLTGTLPGALLWKRFPQPPGQACDTPGGPYRDPRKGQLSGSGYQPCAQGCAALTHPSFSCCFYETPAIYFRRPPPSVSGPGT